MSEPRLPPQSKTAEQAVLGSMLRDNRSIDSVREIIRADDFYFNAHQIVFRLIVAACDRREPIDLVILAEKLKAAKQIDEVGGCRYLAELLDTAPTSANVDYHAKIVRDRSAGRRLIHAGTVIVRDGFEMHGPAEELYANAERELMLATETLTGGEPMTVQEALSRSATVIDARIKGGVPGVMTGYQKLDELLCGFQKRELILLAARPSAGKTAMAVNVLCNVCASGGNVVFFSLEQSGTEIGMRITCRETRVDSHQLRSGHVSHANQGRLAEIFNMTHHWKMSIDDTRTITASAIASRARRMARRQKIDLIIVDYIQYLEPEDRRLQRHEQLDVSSRRLRALAQELDVPVVALAQVRREAEDRAEQRPKLRDLKESGALEQNADTVIFLHRLPRDQQPKASDGKPARQLSPDIDVIELLVDKNRNGPCGELELIFRKPIMRFEELGLSY